MDFCGSGFRIYECLKPHHDVEIFVGAHHNPFGHPVKNVVATHKDKKRVQSRCDLSDVIHIKGDFPHFVFEREWGLKFRKPTVITPTGSFFRRKSHGGFEKFDTSFYRGFKTSSDTGLLYKDFSDIWTPLPINCKNEPNLFKQGNILSHSPTDQSKKNTEFVFRVFDEVSSRRNITIDLIEKVSFAEAVERRKKSTIFFDQFKVGFYGNSALEAMQWGIPVACYLLPSKHLAGCPVIDIPLVVNMWADEVCKILDSDMSELSRKTKQWCDDVHSYESVAKRLTEIYQLAVK
jgi:hypothetical protein